MTNLRQGSNSGQVEIYVVLDLQMLLKSYEVTHSFNVCARHMKMGIRANDRFVVNSTHRIHFKMAMH